MPRITLAPLHCLCYTGVHCGGGVPTILLVCDVIVCGCLMGLLLLFVSLTQNPFVYINNRCSLLKGPVQWPKCLASVLMFYLFTAW